MYLPNAAVAGPARRLVVIVKYPSNAVVAGFTRRLEVIAAGFSPR